MKHHRQVEGRDARRAAWDSQSLDQKHGTKRPGSLSKGAPGNADQYRKGVGAQRSRKATT